MRRHGHRQRAALAHAGDARASSTPSWARRWPGWRSRPCRCASGGPTCCSCSSTSRGRWRGRAASDPPELLAGREAAAGGLRTGRATSEELKRRRRAAGAALRRHRGARAAAASGDPGGRRARAAQRCSEMIAAAGARGHHRGAARGAGEEDQGGGAAGHQPPDAGQEDRGLPARRGEAPGMIASATSRGRWPPRSDAGPAAGGARDLGARAGPAVPAQPRAREARARRRCRREGAVPAPMAVHRRRAQAGLTEAETARLATGTGLLKIGSRDLAVAVAHEGDRRHDGQRDLRARGARRASRSSPPAASAACTAASRSTSTSRRTCRRSRAARWRWCAPGRSRCSICRRRWRCWRRSACRCSASAPTSCPGFFTPRDGARARALGGGRARGGGGAARAAGAGAGRGGVRAASAEGAGDAARR